MVSSQFDVIDDADFLNEAVFMKIKGETIRRRKQSFICFAVYAAILFMVLFVWLYRDSARLAAETGYLYQLNSRFMDRELRLELVKSDLYQRISSNETIYPKKANYNVYAGEEIVHTAAWYDILVHSKEYDELDDSLKAIISDMAADIRTIDASFDVLQKLPKKDQKRRFAVMKGELAPACTRLIQKCQDFVMANALSFRLKNSASLRLHENHISVALAACFAFVLMCAFAVFLQMRRDMRVGN